MTDGRGGEPDPPLAPGYYLGLLSGTSADGVDAALVLMDAQGHPDLIHARSFPYDPEVRRGLTALAGDDCLRRLGALHVEIAEAFARAGLEVLGDAGIRPERVVALGSHGQTVYHAPDGPRPFSLQIGEPAVIAERTGITTVADFRPRDLAAGGQGAPLVPAFHQARFAARDHHRVILNLGGIANLTWLPAGGGVTGFDTGPANVLLDAWAHRHLGTPFDRDGAFAARGRVRARLLEALLADPYFSRPPPKSTGPEHFNLAWLDARLAQWDGPLDPADVQATLAVLTARSAADALRRHCPGAEAVYLCGGGVHNAALRRALEEALAPLPVATTAALGLAPDWVEACAFAWLAARTLQGLPGNLPAVTGARHPVVLGAVWPGRPGRAYPDAFLDGD